MDKPLDIVTANRLRDGAVVYWAQGGFAEALGAAELLAGPEAVKAALAAAGEAVAARLIVNPYSFKVRIEAGLAVPLETREAIRAAGPSVAPHLGKQADPALASRPVAAATPPAAKEGFDVSL